MRHLCKQVRSSKCQCKKLRNDALSSPMSSLFHVRRQTASLSKAKFNHKSWIFIKKQSTWNNVERSRLKRTAMTFWYDSYQYIPNPEHNASRSKCPLPPKKSIRHLPPAQIPPPPQRLYATRRMTLGRR